MELSVQELTIVSTLAGTFIGSFFTFLVMWVSKHYEERKHFRELMIHVASEHWKHTTTTTATRPEGGWVQPFDVYLISMLKLSKLLSRKHLTPEKVLEIIKETEEMTDIIIKHKQKRSKS